MKRFRILTLVAILALAATAAGAQQSLDLYLDFDYSEDMQNRKFAAGFCSAYDSGVGSPAPQEPPTSGPAWIPVRAFGHSISNLPKARGILERAAKGDTPGNMTTGGEDGPITFAFERTPDFYSPRIQQAYLLGGTHPKARLVVVPEGRHSLVMKFVLHDVYVAYYSLIKPGQPHQFTPDLPVQVAAPPAGTGGLGGMIVGGPLERFLLRCETVQTISW